MLLHHPLTHGYHRTWKRQNKNNKGSSDSSGGVSPPSFFSFSSSIRCIMSRIRIGIT